MLCQVASSTPAAVARTLRDDRSAQPVLEWLNNIRISIEEYDPLITVRPPTPEEPKPDAFDEILSQLGKEIYKLDEYQRNLVSEEKEVSLSILNIFDEFLDELDDNDSENTEMTDLELSDVNEVKPVNGVSDSESTLSDVSFVTSAPARDVLREVIPIPPRKARLKTPSPSPSYMEIKELPNGMAKRLNSESDSESTCWSYKECSTDGEHDDKSTYAEMWLQSTGYGKSNELLQRIISQNQATISCISFDTVSDFSPAQYSVYSLHEVGDRCDRPVAMTPDGQTDDGYEPVGDAITTDENEYAEIEFGNSYTDEGYSCGSVEAESCSNSASSEYVGRESPFYVNLKDLGAYSVTPDVIFWTKLLQDPYYNEDEEDEWITPEECAVYSREQRPPLVIPRITQYRRDPPPRRQQYVTHGYNDEASKSSVRQYDLQDWPMDRDFERSFATDSPPSGRINRNFVGSTENLRNPVRPNFLQLPASSSGDNLDVEVRERDIGYNRSRKSQSVAVPKNRRSPMPMLLPHNEGQFPEIKREGPVKRTKFSENGKKCRKNWVDCYMILTPTALVFYRDYKTYKASKILRPPGTPSAQAELVLPLQNAHVVECRHHHTRRYTRSLVLTVRHDLYLLQDETEEGAKHWMRCIQEVYFNLGRPDDSKRDELPLQYQSSNTDLESLGRTPPVSRHSNRSHQKAGGSSNEDLSDSTEVSISKVKTTLRNFFVKRPTKDFLVKKGIYQEEPVFGRKLEEVCPATSPRIPDFVVACVREIESNEENMCTDGLYRASGNLSQVQKIRLEVDQNHLTVIESNTDIHVLTGSLKLFFRELKEPLIPCNIFDKVLAACSIKPKEAKIKKFKDIVNALPQCNRDTLKFLLEHLLRVTQYSERNRMSTANLAIVFGPTLLWAPAEQAHNIAIDCIQQNHVVEILLNEFNEIFDDGKGKKKT